MEQIEDQFLDLYPSSPEYFSDSELFPDFDNFLNTHESANAHLSDVGLVRPSQITFDDLRVFLIPFSSVYPEIPKFENNNGETTDSFQAYFFDHLVERYISALRINSKSGLHVMLRHDIWTSLSLVYDTTRVMNVLTYQFTDYYFCTHVRTRFPSLLVDLARHQIKHFATQVNDTFMTLTQEAKYLEQFAYTFQNYLYLYGLSYSEDNLIAHFKGTQYHPALSCFSGNAIGDFLIKLIKLQDDLANESMNGLSSNGTLLPEHFEVNFDIKLSPNVDGNFSHSLKTKSNALNFNLSDLVEQSPSIAWEIYKSKVALSTCFSNYATLNNIQNHQSKDSTKLQTYRTNPSTFLKRLPHLTIDPDEVLNEWSGLAYKIDVQLVIFSRTLFPTEFSALTDCHRDLLLRTC